VDTVPVALDDKQETFFLVCCSSLLSECIKLTFSQSETLKYLYLTFSDSSVLPLNGMYLVYLLHTQFHPMLDLFSLVEYVFNTEVSTIFLKFNSFNSKRVSTIECEGTSSSYLQAINQTCISIILLHHHHMVTYMLHTVFAMDFLAYLSLYHYFVPAIAHCFDKPNRTWSF
jgi:hypothetical protein